MSMCPDCPAELDNGCCPNCGYDRDFTPARRSKEKCAPLTDSEADDSGWLVEKGDASRPKYLTIFEHKWHWTHDHIEALRFARKQDAEKAASHFLLSHSGVERIAEHSWGPNEKLTDPTKLNRTNQQT